MKTVPWGELYNQFNGKALNPATLEGRVAELMEDEDVTRQPGIYSYVLDGKEKHLSIRAFLPKMKRQAYERQKGICPVCKEHFEYDGMHGDHITPWHLGGKTVAANCQMLCKDDNRKKSGV